MDVERRRWMELSDEGRCGRTWKGCVEVVGGVGGGEVAWGRSGVE